MGLLGRLRSHFLFGTGTMLRAAFVAASRLFVTHLTGIRGSSSTS